MRFQNPHYISTLQKKKVQDIKSYAKRGINPLHVTLQCDNAEYSYNSVDVRNYFEATNKSFDLVVGGE